MRSDWYKPKEVQERTSKQAVQNEAMKQILDEQREYADRLWGKRPETSDESGK